jgi:CDP-2,3-bis-(O-geranylgeranyl)-sn-glycerol synthase
LLACRLLLPLTMLDIGVAAALFFVGELVLSRILFRLHLRDRPY